MPNNCLSCLKKLACLCLLISPFFPVEIFAQTSLSTDYFRISIDGKGFITSMINITKTPGQEFGRKDKPSPLLCLYNSRKSIYYQPQSAVYSAAAGTMTLNFPNGSVAFIKVKTKSRYFTFTLQSLTNRAEIDDVQWGPYCTEITNLFGEIIGVARDTSDAVNYAIGVLSLDDSTTGGQIKQYW